MAVYTDVLATDIHKEYIDAYRRYCDGELHSYRIIAQEGYVLHDPTSDAPLLDENGDPSGEYYIEYYRQAYIPLRLDPSIWTWEAVPESSVTEIM